MGVLDMAGVKAGNLGRPGSWRSESHEFSGFSPPSNSQTRPPSGTASPDCLQNGQGWWVWGVWLGQSGLAVPWSVWVGYRLFDLEIHVEIQEGV